MSSSSCLSLALPYLERGQACVLLLVVDSQGSSPGRTGFRMVVAPDGQMAGSIGGGIMEHKLVELARHQLTTQRLETVIKRQIHRAEATADRSGMICSGEQTVLLLPLLPEELLRIALLVDALENRQRGHFALSQAGIEVRPTEWLPDRFRFTAGQTWRYEELLDPRETVHVVGAGHVGLACCELLSKLDFRIRLYDDRPDLNTFHQNQFADEKIITPYEELGRHVPEGPDHYVAIMTFGYRTDDVAVRQVLGKRLRYLGLMGSEAKIEKLVADLRADGFPEEQLAQLHAPIGVPINSKTPAEIAVSVAAQLIAVRNQEE